MDKYARQTFIHNYGEPDYFPTNVYDREIPTEPLDIYMTSPPCQAFSLAGKRKGKEDMRGILFFNSLEFIRINKPRYFIFENVKGLLSDDNGKTFSEWVNLLGGKSVNGDSIMFPYEDSVPYHLYWQVLNAKHHGVPQNRERVFLVGIRDDKDNTFRFPAEEHLTKRLKDVLDDEVDDKYYLSSKMVEWIGSHREKRDSSNKFPSDENDIGSCINARYFKMGAEDQYIKVGTWRTHEDGPLILDDYNSKINDTGIIGTITGNIGSKAERNGHKVILPNAGQEPWGGNAIVIDNTNDFNESKPRIYNEYAPSIRSERHGLLTIAKVEYGDKRLNETIKKNKLEQGEIKMLDTYNKSVHDECPALKARHAQNNDRRLWDGYRIRRLTPRECFRLMDFDESFSWICSDSQAYKQAGNSIVVNVLYKIIKNLNL